MAQNQPSANGYFSMIIVGNLAADPELRYTPSGKAVCNFRMAVNQRMPGLNQGDDGWGVAAQWFKVAVWGKQAEACNAYLHQGSRVLVEAGRFNFDVETGAPELFTRTDGTNGANYEITAETVKFMDGRPSAEAEAEVQPVEETIDFG